VSRHEQQLAGNSDSELIDQIVPWMQGSVGLDERKIAGHVDQYDCAGEG